MTELSYLFRAVALERAASPEQLDHLVRVTKPSDWILAAMAMLAVATALVWGIVGRIPTRAAGEGILISSGGRVVDAVSATGGRLAAVEVGVGDRVATGQVIAEIALTDIQQRHDNAVEVYREREREHADLTAKIRQELALKAENFAKEEAAFNQIVKAAGQRIEYLTLEVHNSEGLLAKGYAVRRDVEDNRRQLTEAQQRKDEAQNEILKLRAQKTDLETQREREIQDSEFRLNDARREMDSLAGELGRNTKVLSPIEGRVLELKVSAGSVLGVGTPVIAVETAGTSLEAVVYVSAEYGKSVKPGMEVRLEPSTVKREEFGTMLGTVASVSEFPMTPQGMAAVLHNDSLVTKFSHDGAPYAVSVRLQQDAATVSGYRWAVGNGPPLRLSSGTLAKAEITTRKQRPLDLVIPIIRRLTGIEG
jgi:HlyD family secretion protein